MLDADFAAVLNQHIRYEKQAARIDAIEEKQAAIEAARAKEAAERTAEAAKIKAAADAKTARQKQIRAAITPAKPSAVLAEKLAAGITTLAASGMDRRTLFRVARQLNADKDTAPMGAMLIRQIRLANQRTRLGERIAAQLENKGLAHEQAADIAAKLAGSTSRDDIDRYAYAARTAAKKQNSEPLLVARQGAGWQLVPAVVPARWKPRAEPPARVTLAGLAGAVKTIAFAAATKSAGKGRSAVVSRVAAGVASGLAQELAHALQQASQAGNQIAGSVADGFSMAVKTAPAGKPTTGKTPASISAALRRAEQDAESEAGKKMGPDVRL